MHRNWQTIASDTTLSHHPHPYQPIQNPAEFTTILSILNKHNGSSRQDSWHYYQYTPTYTNSDIPTVIHPQWQHFPPLLIIRHTQLILALRATQWNIKTYFEDQVITQRLWDTPTPLLLCWLIRNFSYALLIKKLFGPNNIFLYTLCHQIVFSLWDFLFLSPIPTSRTSILSYTHKKVFPYTVFECCHNIQN